MRQRSRAVLLTASLSLLALFAGAAATAPPGEPKPPAAAAGSPIANMIQAKVGPNTFQGYGSSSEGFGGLTLHCNPVRCSHAWTGDAWTMTLADNGGGVLADVYYWRPLPAQWRNKPLRIADNGPPALAAELQIGAWSSRTGNRIDPPPGDDGTNGTLRARRKIDLEPGQAVEWSVVILGECQREDLDGSGDVDAADHALLLGAWSPPKPGSDG